MFITYGTTVNPKGIQAGMDKLHLAWKVAVSEELMYVGTNECICLNLIHTKPWEFLTQESECWAISFYCLHKFFMRPNLICRGGGNTLHGPTRDWWATFFVPVCVIYVEANSSCSNEYFWHKYPTHAGNNRTLCNFLQFCQNGSYLQNIANMPWYVL
jgi:hypothetical protein